MTANRRAGRVDQHQLIVRISGESLRIVCSCGTVVGGRRYEDRTMVTLSDLLELVRVHAQQLDHG